MKRGKIILLIVLGLVIILGTVLGFQLSSAIGEAKTMAQEEITAPPLNTVPDGTWRGAVNWGIIKVEVEVEVAGSEISAIQLLKHDNGMGNDAEIITENVLSNQSVDVDTVSGATISSRAILAAIADALNNSQ